MKLFFKPHDLQLRENRRVLLHLAPFPSCLCPWLLFADRNCAINILRYHQQHFQLSQGAPAAMSADISHTSSPAAVFVGSRQTHVKESCRVRPLKKTTTTLVANKIKTILDRNSYNLSDIRSQSTRTRTSDLNLHYHD